MLAWISDRDGRPRAWVAPLPPGRLPGRRAGLAAADRRRTTVTAGSRGTCRRSPGRPTATGSPASSPPAGASAPASGSSPRTAPQVRDLAPGAAGGHARLLVAHRAPARRSRLRAGTRRRPGLPRRRARRHVDGAHLRPRGAGLRGERRRHARRGARSAAAAPAGWSCSTCAAGGAPSCSPAARRTSPTPVSASPAASSTCTPTPGASGPRCWPSGSTGDAEPSLPYLVAGRDDDDLDLVALDPAGARAALVWNVDGRSEIDLLDLRSGITRAAPPAARRRRHRRWRSPATGGAAGRQRGPDRPAADHPDRARRCDRSGADAGHARCCRRLRATPGTSSTPCCTTFRGEDGLALSGLAVPARERASAPVPDAHLAARRPGGPGTPDLPAAVPGAARRGRRGVRAERPRLRRVRPQFSQADDLDRRFVAITDVRAAVTSWSSTALADPARVGVSGPLVRRLPHAGGAGLVPGAVPGRGRRLRDLGLRHVLRRRPSRGSRRRPSPSTATRTRTPRCCTSCRRSTASTGSPRRCWWCTARYDTNVPIVEAEQIVEALRDRGASPGFLLFDDEGHEVHGTENRALFVREVVRVGHRAPAGRGRADGLSGPGQAAQRAERLDDLAAVLACRGRTVGLATDLAVLAA